MTDKLPEIMTKLQQQMGREPPATVTNIEDYAPKRDLKSEQISDGLREIVNELSAIKLAQREQLDAQAELLAKMHNLLAEMRAAIL